jgi:hypothetical protein
MRVIWNIGEGFDDGSLWSVSLNNAMCYMYKIERPKLFPHITVFFTAIELVEVGKRFTFSEFHVTFAEDKRVYFRERAECEWLMEGESRWAIPEGLKQVARKWAKRILRGLRTDSDTRVYKVYEMVEGGTWRNRTFTKNVLWESPAAITST